MEVRVVRTYTEAEQIWLGLEREGHRRKVFRAITEAQVGATNVVAGLTIFDPGERSAPHCHPDSEEICFAVSGGGVVVDVTHRRETRFRRHDFMWIPPGVEHVHYNDGEEPLLLLWAYTPPGSLPDR